jgi:hypothetical protein
MNCIHCDYHRTASQPDIHICKVAVREWVARWASHAPSAAMLIAEDLIHLQCTGQHLWRPNTTPFMRQV